MMDMNPCRVLSLLKIVSTFGVISCMMSSSIPWMMGKDVSKGQESQ